MTTEGKQKLKEYEKEYRKYIANEDEQKIRGCMKEYRSVETVNKLIKDEVEDVDIDDENYDDNDNISIEFR